MLAVSHSGPLFATNRHTVLVVAVHEKSATSVAGPRLGISESACAWAGRQSTMWPLLHFDSTDFSVTASLGSIKVDCLGGSLAGVVFMRAISILPVAFVSAAGDLGRRSWRCDSPPRSGVISQCIFGRGQRCRAAILLELRRPARQTSRRTCHPASPRLCSSRSW